MQSMYASPGATIRASFYCALALGLTGFMAFSSRAGPTPSVTSTPSATPTPTPFSTPTATPSIDFCDFHCDLDKLCSVGASGPQDQCVASPGEQVTYYYQVDLAGGPVEVWDDQLGFIGVTSGATLTRTTTLSVTTTNWGSLVASAADCDCGSCYCAFGNPVDAVTVTVVTPTPTASPTPTPTAPPTPCEVAHPVTTLYTIGKGQSPSNNAKVSHAIVGNIIDPGAVCSEVGACTAHRIPVCAGTEATITSTDSSGGATNSNIGRGDIACLGNVCSVPAVNVTEKYKSVSADGTDTDRMSLLPR
jgi:hypothetical protein